MVEYWCIYPRTKKSLANIGVVDIQLILLFLKSKFFCNRRNFSSKMSPDPLSIKKKKNQQNDATFLLFHNVFPLKLISFHMTKPCKSYNEKSAMVSHTNRLKCKERIKVNASVRFVFTWNSTVITINTLAWRQRRRC